MWRCRGEADYECEKIDEGIKTCSALYCSVRRCSVQGEQAGTPCTCQPPFDAQSTIGNVPPA